MKKLITLLIVATSLSYSASLSCDQGYKVDQFVKRFYKVVLGRDADDRGREKWDRDLIFQTKTAADVAKGFVFSAEFENKNTDDDAYLATLYKAFFNREADAEGLSYWLERIDAGASREEVLDGFLYSDEFVTLSNDYGIKAYEGATVKPPAVSQEVTDFIKRFYTTILQREADAEGLSYWEQKLVTKELTATELAKGFIFSNEFIAQNNDDVDYVNVLYKAFFNREADTAGFNAWIEHLATDKTREEVLDGFLQSDEFAALAQSYSIKPFSEFDDSLPFVDKEKGTAFHEIFAVHKGLYLFANREGLGDTHSSNRWTAKIQCYWWELEGNLVGSINNVTKADFDIEVGRHEYKFMTMETDGYIRVDQIMTEMREHRGSAIYNEPGYEIYESITFGGIDYRGYRELVIDYEINYEYWDIYYPYDYPPLSYLYAPK